jgi:hypothetical protein
MTPMEERMLKALAATGGLALAALLILPAAASAADAPAPGTLTMTPAAGHADQAPKVHTSAGCVTGTDGYFARLYGPGPFASGYLIVSPQDPGFSTTEGFDVQLTFSFSDAAADLGTTIVAGDYPLWVSCVDQFSGDVKAQFGGVVTFSSATDWTFSSTPAPTPTPTDTTTPAPTATPTRTASPTPAATATDDTSGGGADDPAPTPTASAPAGTLPITGPPIVGTLTVGIAFVLLGFATLSLTDRQR